jgi:hypothetical protein
MTSKTEHEKLREKHREGKKYNLDRWRDATCPICGGTAIHSCDEYKCVKCGEFGCLV